MDDAKLCTNHCVIHLNSHKYAPNFRNVIKWKQTLVTLWLECENISSMHTFTWCFKTCFSVQKYRTHVKPNIHIFTLILFVKLMTPSSFYTP
jgi:hypothetical protein